MKQLFKKFVIFAVVIISAFSVLGGCGEGGGDKPVDAKTPTTNLALPTFTEDKNFTIWADVPANPQVEEYLRVYKEAGFTHYNLTEDWVKFTNVDNVYGTEDDGVINQKYLDAIALCNSLGLNVLIRNYYADSDYFVNDNDGDRPYAHIQGTYSMPKRNITTELTQLPAVGGYYMGDEPTWQQVLTYDKLIEWYNSYGGNTLWHMNLLQSYGAFLFEDAEGNMYNYEEYVDRY